MAKINLYLSAIDHVTKVSLADTFAVIESGGCDGIKTKTAAALAERPVRPLSTKGLKNGVYAVPAHIAAEVGFAEIAVKWSWNRKVGARIPYLSIDGEYTPASNPNRRRAVTLVTEGIAVPVAATEVADDLAI